jgi:hypothetical protein
VHDASRETFASYPRTGPSALTITDARARQVGGTGESCAPRHLREIRWWWVAEFPAFPGACSQGRTRAEAPLLSAMRDLIEVYADEAPKSDALASR